MNNDLNLNDVAAEALDGARGVLSREGRLALHEQTDEQRCETLRRLLQPVLRRRIDNRLLRDIDSVVQRYVEFLARHGIGFPQITAVIFEERNQIDLVRADLDDAGIQQVVRNAITRFPDITPRELVIAIHNTFPDYKRAAVSNQVQWEKSKKADHLNGGA